MIHLRVCDYDLTLWIFPDLFRSTGAETNLDHETSPGVPAGPTFMPQAARNCTFLETADRCHPDPM